MFIYPYKQGSASAIALAEALNAKIIRLENSKFRGSQDKIVINWGNSMTNEEIEKATVLNNPQAVGLASNKLKFFELVKGKVSIPPFSTNINEASNWIEQGKTVVVREVLNGHSGEGIVLLNDPVSFDLYNHTRAKLYVQYIPKKEEYRLHVVGDKVMDVQKKLRSSEAREVNWKIRNHQNGFIYARTDVSLPDKAMEADAVNSVQLCGLHFGAVDMIWNEYQKKGYVLEVNTAPGLQGGTVQKYQQGIEALLSNREDIVERLVRDWPQPTREVTLGLMPRAAFGREQWVVSDRPVPHVEPLPETGTPS